MLMSRKRSKLGHMLLLYADMKPYGEFNGTITFWPWATLKGLHVVKVTDFVSTRNGPEWRKVRSVLDKQMMNPSHVATYAHKITDVNADFLHHLRRMRSDDKSVPNMDKELLSWALESGHLRGWPLWGVE